MKKIIMIIAVMICISSMAMANYGDYIPKWDWPIYRQMKSASPWIDRVNVVIQKKEWYPNWIYDKMTINTYCDPTDENWWKITISIQCTYDGVVGSTTGPVGPPRPVIGRVTGEQTWVGEVPPMSTWGQTTWNLIRNEEFTYQTWPCDYCVQPSTFSIVSWESE